MLTECRSYLMTDPAMLRLLLEFGMNPDLPNWLLATPLHDLCGRDGRGRPHTDSHSVCDHLARRGGQYFRTKTKIIVRPRWHGLHATTCRTWSSLLLTLVLDKACRRRTLGHAVGVGDPAGTRSYYRPASRGWCDGVSSGRMIGGIGSNRPAFATSTCRA